RAARPARAQAHRASHAGSRCPLAAPAAPMPAGSVRAPPARGGGSAATARNRPRPGPAAARPAPAAPRPACAASGRDDQGGTDADAACRWRLCVTFRKPSCKVVSRRTSRPLQRTAPRMSAGTTDGRGAAGEPTLQKPRKAARRKGMAVTLDEVAALAKVSPMTVSRVVNGQGKVRDTTRERERLAVREQGYTPNLAATALATAQETRVAMIYSNPSNAYLRELLAGALRAATRTAAQLVIDSWDNLGATAQRQAARALAKRVAG